MREREGRKEKGKKRERDMIVVHGVVVTYKARKSSKMVLIQVPYLVELILSMKKLEWLFLPQFCKCGK